MSNPNTRKSCVVPKCTNTTTNAPEKLFFFVPMDVKMRKRWLQAMNRLDPFGDRSKVYCCEDHFDIENDMENYVKFKLVGGPLKLKRDVMPHKFSCQKRQVEKPVRCVVKKRKRAELINNKEANEAKKKELETSENIEKSFISSPTTNTIKVEDSEIIEPYVVQCDYVASPGEDMGDGDAVSLYPKSPKSSILETSKPSAGQMLTENTYFHTGYTCNSCYSEINGYRYTCVQCLNYDLCGACESRGAHCMHYVLRIPKLAPFIFRQCYNCHDHGRTDELQSEVELVLNKVRAQLSHAVNLQSDEQPATADEQPSVLGMKVEVKEEPDPLMTEDGMETVATYNDIIDMPYTAPNEATQPCSMLNVNTATTTEIIHGNTLLIIENPVRTDSVVSSDTKTKRTRDAPIHVPTDKKRVKLKPQDPQVLNIGTSSYIDIPITGYVPVPTVSGTGGEHVPRILRRGGPARPREGH